MQDDERLTAANAELAAALGGLSPAAARLDRDELMFLAGRASVRPMRTLALAATAASLLLGAGLALSLLGWPATRTVERIVYVREPAGPPQPAQHLSLAQADAAPPASQPLVADGRAEPAGLAWFARSFLKLEQPEYLRLREDFLVRGEKALPPASSSGGESVMPFASDRAAFLKQLTNSL